ncbi:myosin regulatory light chain B, smooth adductor muscle-like [Culicoides brevitarsis]|uniref:myosin regulatory light chain B, smooth adductor muscle-like n=1 Tax=Culicoides brevitarsis TaxID=469753 RepID=UPI00307B336F
MATDEEPVAVEEQQPEAPAPAKEKKSKKEPRMKWVVEMDDNVYKPPEEVEQGDESALGYLEMEKLLELREAFNVIDLNHDGLIDFEDLKGLFLSMGSSQDDETIAGMIEEGNGPLNFEQFAKMMLLKTCDLDTEEDLRSTFQLWDKKIDSGLINEDVLLTDLISKGERMTEKEAFKALEEVVYQKGTECNFGSMGSPMVDYPAWCKKISAFRRNPKDPSEPPTPLPVTLKQVEIEHEASLAPPEHKK